MDILDKGVRQSFAFELKLKNKAFLCSLRELIELFYHAAKKKSSS